VREHFFERRAIEEGVVPVNRAAVPMNRRSSPRIGDNELVVGKPWGKPSDERGEGSYRSTISHGFSSYPTSLMTTPASRRPPASAAAPAPTVHRHAR
jgi:hypothetical protein